MNWYEEFTECVQTVYLWRKKMDSKFPTPPKEHILLFTLEEIGEVIRSYMRTFPVYARNRQESHTIAEEWADVLMMLSTLEVDKEKTEGFLTNDYMTEAFDVVDLSILCMSTVCSLLESVHQGQKTDNIHYAYMTADLMCTIMFNNITWKDDLLKKLESLEKKHGNNAT